MFFWLFAVFFFSLSSFSAFAEDSAESDAPIAHINVIYGTDGRHEISDAREGWIRSAAKRTFSFFDRDDLKAEGSSFYEVQGSTLREESNLCGSERFGAQKQAAFCTGFLVAPDLIVSAGHCIKDLKKDCAKMRLVLGYVTSAEDPHGQFVPKESVYKCAKVIVKKNNETLDFSIIQLDRPVQDRPPLRLRRSGVIPVRSPVLAIGSPSGVPLKVSRGALVKYVDKKSFWADIDVFAGSSGSPVFHEKSKWVEGILVDGVKDYEWNASKKCYTSHRCTMGTYNCDGEKIISIAEVLPYLGSKQID